MARGRNKGNGKRSATSHRTPEQESRRYAEYHSKPDQMKKRAQRNKARRIMVKAGLAKKGDGKDVGHKKPLGKGGTSARSNLAMQSAKKNRGHGTSPGVKRR